MSQYYVNGGGSSPGSGITTIDGDTGSTTGTTVTFNATSSNVGFNNAFQASGSTVDLVLNSSFTGDLFWGAGTGVTSGSFQNTIIGNFSANALTGGAQWNTSIGLGNLNLSTGSSNTALGTAALGFIAGAGSFNVAVGFLGDIATAAGTVGGSFATTESSNIVIQNTGVVGDNHTIRIGTEGSGNAQQNKCFIAGIANATITGSAVIIDTGTGQLGLVVSSQRFKTDIVPLKDTRITDLEPVSFVYINDTQQRSQFGLIAEQVAEIIPELVEYRDDVPYTVHYHMLAPLLLAEIKVLKARIEKLENVV